MEHKLSKPHVKKFVDRFKKNSNVIVFDQKEILETNYEKWPKVSFLISFYHTSLPLHKVYKYIKLNNIPCINDLFMQYSLFDRRVIYTILMALKIKVPEHYFVNRCQAKIPRELKVYLEKRFATSFVFEETSIEEHNTHIIINGNILKKPFVEKPVNAEDHNIYVYLQDGSVRKLFRKQANVSSKVFWDIKEIRKSGSFIYEKFYPADDDNDIKVYALGKETAYAETRKAPTKDGFVERLECGKEKRNMIKLLDHEYEYARKITTGFNQFVCGFDILRSNGVSYVIDVNGWSFVKNNRTYYDKCAELLKREIEKRTNAFKCTCQNQGTETNTTIIGTENTDKSTNKSQKNLQEELARMENQASMENNNYGSNENQSKKVTAQMKISENDMKGTELEPTKLIIKPNHNNYELTIKNEMYAQPMHKNTTEQQQPRKKCTCQNKKIQKIVRVYRHGDRTPKQKLKVKMKATNNMFNKEVYVQESFDNIIDVFTKMNNDNLLPVINCLNTYKNQKGTKLQIKFVNGCAEIICKWGGVLTHTGAFHCHELADGLNYYVSDNNTEIFDNMKIYSSSEGRVYESALEFANSFGNRKFEVIKDKELLDDTFHATELIEAGRKGLSLEFEKFKTTEDEEYFLRTFENIKLQEDDNKANKQIDEPNNIQEKQTGAIDNEEKQNDESKQEKNGCILKEQNVLNDNEEKPDTQSADTTEQQILNVQDQNLKNGENNKNTQEIYDRWFKIKQKVLKDSVMSYNKISEISDNLKYDLIHNNEKIKEIFENDKIVEFYLFIRKYYRFLLENEYGTSKEEKKHISKAISGNLLAKMISKINDTGADIFFTKESRMYTLFNLLKNLDSKKDISKEFNYASYIGFNVYESNNEMRVSIVFSRGFNCRDIIEGCLDSRHRAPLKDEELLCDLSLQCFVDHCEAVLNKK